MLPKESLSSPTPQARLTSGLRAAAHFVFHTLGLRFLLALVSAFALWWYVVGDGSNTGNTPGLATGSYLTVTVVAQLYGSPADGYEVTSVQVAPPSVTIQGTVPGLGDTNSVNTDPIEITGATTTLTRVVGLNLPPGVSSTTTTVTVSIYVAPLSGKVAATVPVTLQNLAPNLTGTSTPTSVSVTLRGLPPKLNTVEIQPVVDVSGLGPGSYLLPVQVAAPPDIRVQITPADVTVTLTPTH